MKQIINVEFLYRKKKTDSYWQRSFNSKEGSIKEAMCNFLTKKRKIKEIHPTILVTYLDGSEDIIEVDPRQALTKEWWFLYENRMICKNGEYDW